MEREHTKEQSREIKKSLRMTLRSLIIARWCFYLVIALFVVFVAKTYIFPSQNTQKGKYPSEMEGKIVQPTTNTIEEEIPRTTEKPTEQTQKQTEKIDEELNKQNKIKEVEHEITESVVLRKKEKSKIVNLSWSTISIEPTMKNIGIYKPQLDITKKPILISKNGQQFERINQNNKIVGINDRVIYEVVVSNNGNYKATNVKITESLDVNLINTKNIYQVTEEDIVRPKVKAGNELLIFDTFEANQQVKFWVVYTITKIDMENLTNSRLENMVTLTAGRTRKESTDITIEKEMKCPYIVNYLEKDTNEVLCQAKTVSNQTYGTVITSELEKIEIEGYKYDSAEKATITLGTKENVINLYYTKRADLSYTVKYLEKDTNVELADTVTRTSKTFNETCTENAEEINGYTPDTTKKEIKLDKYNKELIFYYTANTDTPYKVEYYYQKDDGTYQGRTDKFIEKTGTTNTETTVEDDDKIPEEVLGKVYVFDKKNQNNKLSGTIAGDGTLVLKVYFKQQYTVTYKRGSHGTFDEQKTSNLDYNTNTPKFNGTANGGAGYAFAGWLPVVAKFVKGNDTYTAQWTGLEISKVRTDIVDKDGLDNNTYVDQQGDVIKYTIKVENKSDEIISVKLSDITLTDDRKVKVTSIRINSGENLLLEPKTIQAKQNLLAGLVSEDKVGTIEVEVEYTVTETDINESLKNNKKLINVATAVLNGIKYTATDKTDEKEGTDVKERCTYSVKYYFNGKEEYKEGYTLTDIPAYVGLPVGFDEPKENIKLDGYTFIKWLGFDGMTRGSTVTKSGNNIIKIYYGKPEIQIKKEATKGPVKAGEKIEYIISVTNSGWLGTDVIIEDNLDIDLEYLESNHNVTKNGQMLTWKLTLPAGYNDITNTTDEKKERITFTAKVKKCGQSEIINTVIAKVEGEADKTAVATTLRKEIVVNYKEFIEGQKGTDLNITFVVDNSSSMNFPINGNYENEDSPIAPSDRERTRIYAAKEAMKTLIEKQNKNPKNSMQVITFNTPSNLITNDLENSDGYTRDMKTLVADEEINDKGEVIINGKTYKVETNQHEMQVITYKNKLYPVKVLVYKYVLINDKKYKVEDNIVTIDEVKYMVEKKVVNERLKYTSSDGEEYPYIKEHIQTGAHLVGDNSNGNQSLIEKVNTISITGEQSGLGTHIKPALQLINNNLDKYIQQDKKNIIIVLADGKFNDGPDSRDDYSPELTKLKKNEGLEIYCIGFGSGKEFDEKSLKDMSTNDTCYKATNMAELLDQFDAILEEATTVEGEVETSSGEIILEETDRKIKISKDTPIVATYKNGEIDETLFTCTDKTKLVDYGLKIENEGTIISWNANIFAEKHPEAVPLPDEIDIKYYIPRKTTK